MPRQSPFGSLPARIVVFAFLLCLCPLAWSLDRTKANNANNLNTGTSWTGGVPDLSNMAVWTGTVTGANTAALGGNVTWQGIRIANPGGLVTISAGNTLTLSIGQAGISIDMSAATQDLTIQSGLTLRAASGQFWNIGSGRTLTLDTGLFTRDAGATLNIQGIGTVNTNSIANGTTGIIGPWATIGSGTTASYAMVDGSNNIVAYTGGTAAATAANVTDTTGLVNYDVAAVGALGTGASFNTLRYTGAAGTITGDFTANGILTAGSGALTMSGNGRIGASDELVLFNGDSSTTRFLTLSGTLRNGIGTGVTKGGDGTVTLSGNNTYTGVTTVTRGRLSIGSNNALGSSAGGTRVGIGGRLVLNGGLTLSESIWFDDLVNAYAGGTMMEHYGTNTLNGAIRLSNSVRWQSGGVVLNITGGISTTNGNSGSFFVFQPGATANITGKPISIGAGNLYMDNAGRTINLGVQGSTYGSHSFYAGTLIAGASNVLSRSSPIIFSVAYANTSTVLDLNGFDQAVGSIATNTYFVHGSYDRVITSATAATLTTGINNSSTIFDGRLAGAVSLTKVGNGTLTLTGPSTTTGGLTVNRGTVNLNFARATASQTGAGTVNDYLPSAAQLTLGGGTFQLTGRNNGTATSLTTASWAVNNPTITVASTANLAPGQLVSHANLPAGAYVVSVLSNTQFVINALPTVAGASATIIATTNSFSTSQTFAGLTLNAGGSGVTMTKPSSGSDGIVLNLGTITVNAGGTVAFSLTPDTQSATNGVTTNNTNTNGILGGWARVGGNWATNSTNAAGGNIVAYSAYTDVNLLGGTVTSAAATNVRIVNGGASGNITPAATGTTDIHTLLQAATAGGAIYDPGTTDVLRLGAAGGIMTATGAKALTIGASANDGILTAGGADDTAGTLYVINNNTSDLITLNSTITDNGTGIVGMTTAGAGTIVLAGTNTHTGHTVVGAGVLRISSEQNLGGNPLISTADQLILAGGTLNTTASFSIDDSNRGITLAAAGGAISVNGSTTLTVANVISGSGGLTASGTGTLALTAANTFSGTTYVNSGAYLALGHVDALQNSTLNTSDANKVTLTAAGTNTYNLGGLAGSGSITINANSLRVGSNDETTTYTGVLYGTGGLIKVGAGTLNLTSSNASSFSGDTRIEGGMIVLANKDALQNSTLDTGPAGTQSANLTLGEGTVYNFGGLKGSADLDLAVSHLSVGANNQSTTFSGVLLGAFNNNLTKVGTGTLTLTGANTYTGATTVSAGALQVGAAGAGQSGSGDVTVQSGSTILGTGIIRGESFTAASGSTLHAGDSTAPASFGTLNFTPVSSGGTHSLQGSIVLGIGTANNQTSIDATYGGNLVGTPGYVTFVNDIARSQGLGSGSHDLLSFNTSDGGSSYNLVLTGSIQVTGSGFSAEQGQIFNLIDWTNMVATDFTGFNVGTNFRDGSGDDATQFDLPTLGTGLFWDVSQFTTSGIIIVVPEPGRAALLLLGLLGVLSRRRRR